MKLTNNIKDHFDTIWDKIYKEIKDMLTSEETAYFKLRKKKQERSTTFVL